MRLKLDENLGESPVLALAARGHDVSSVYQQRLSGATDLELVPEKVAGTFRGVLCFLLD